MVTTKSSRHTYGLPVEPRFSMPFFYVAFALYTIYILIGSTGYAALLDHTFTFDVFHAPRLIIWALLGIKLVLQRYTPLQFFITVALLILVVATWKYSGQGFEALLFIAAGQNVKISRLARIVLSTTLVFMAVALLGVLVGAIENVQIAADLQTSPTGSNSFGFSQPNTLAYFIFAVVLAWLVLNYEKVSLTNAVIVLLSAVGVFLISRSETYAIAILLAGLLHFLSHKVSARLLAVGALATIVVIAAFSFYTMLVFDPKVPLWNTLDGYLTRRLALTRSYFLMSPNTLFGQSFADTHIWWFSSANGRLLVDNAYCHLWLRYGIASVVTFLVILLGVFVKCFREKRWNEATFGLLLFVIIGMTETSTFSFGYNYFLIAASALIFSVPLKSLEMPHKKSDALSKWLKKKCRRTANV